MDRLLLYMQYSCPAPAGMKLTAMKKDPIMADKKMDHDKM